jgi:hypothetical protein
MTAIQQMVEIDPSRRVLRLETPLPETIAAGRVDMVLVLRDDAPASSHPQTDDVYAGIPAAAAQNKNGWRALIGIDKGRDTMEAYFTRHWAENDCEREQEREQYPEHFRDKQP